MKATTDDVLSPIEKADRRGTPKPPRTSWTISTGGRGPYRLFTDHQWTPSKSPAGFPDARGVANRWDCYLR